MAKKKKKKSISKTRQQLDAYLKIMEEENLNELEVAEGGFQVKLVRQGAVVHTTSHPVGPVSRKKEDNKSAEFGSGKQIKSPIAGVFYCSASPTSPPFVSEGDKIKKGQVLCIVEAMKVMNEITSDLSGKISKIHVENGKPVQANQILFSVD